MVTLKSVAQAAGVSLAAASTALGASSSTTRLAAATRQRVLRVARRMNYRRHPVAASFRTGRTYTLAILLHDVTAYLTHPHGARLFAAGVKAAAERGYRVTAVSLDRDTHLDARLVDGGLSGIPATAEERRELERLAREVPLLNSAEHPPAGSIPLLCDDAGIVAAHRCAAEYLLELGHRRFGVCEVDSRARSSRVGQTFREAAAARGVPVDVVAARDRWETREYAGGQALCDLSPLPTALFAFDDDCARTLILRLAAAGVRVPVDVSVFSGQTHRLGYQAPPALTGIDMHIEEQAAWQVHSLIDIIEGRRPAEPLRVPASSYELVERHSCAAPCQPER